MQDEAQQTPGTEAAAQEPNNALDPWGSTPPPEMAEQAGEEPTAAPAYQGGSAFEQAASMGVEETLSPFASSTPDPASSSADLHSDSTLDNTEVIDDPWGPPPPDAAEQAGGEVVDAPAVDPWGSTPPPGPVEQQEAAPPPVDQPGPDEPSATELVEPMGSEAAPIGGEASRLMGGGALPAEDLRDEAFSGEGEGAPDAAAPAEATAPADAAVGEAAVGAEVVGEAGGSGETEDAGEAVLDPPGAAGDAFISKEQWDHIKEHMPPGTTGGAPSEPGGEVIDAPAAEWNPWDKAAGPVADAAEAAVIEKGEAVEETVEITGEALEDVVESIPFVGDDLGDAVGDATDVAEDVVKEVVEDVGETTWFETYYEEYAAQKAAAEAAAENMGEAVEETVEVTGEALEDVVESIPFVGDDLGDAVGEGTDVAQDLVDDVF